MSSNRWLLAAGLALVLIVGASVAVGTQRGSETEFPPDSPEGTVQRYVRAVEVQDANALRSLLSPGAQQRCELADIRNALRFPTERDLRVTLRDTKLTNDRAEIRVRVTETTGGGSPFDSASYDHEETFDLIRVNDEWVVDQPTWPIYCPPARSRREPAGPLAGPPPASPTPAAAPKSNATPTSAATTSAKSASTPTPVGR